MGASASNSREVPAEILSIHEAAKQLNIIVPVLQTAYFAVISVSDLRTELSGRGWLVLLFLVPAIIWIISLYLSMRIFVPGVKRAGEDRADALHRIVERKYHLLNLAQYLLLAGLVVMVIDFFVFFAFVPVSEPESDFPPVISIGTPTPTPDTAP